MCLSGVKQYPMRVKCATLSWHTLVSAMENNGKEISTEKWHFMEIKDKIIEEIKKIYDPELPVNIYDLGLIYDVQVNQKKAKIKMTGQLNVGFSGGEKKKNEILQMSMLSPKLSILDETDSGLDIDALKVVSDGVNTLRSKDNSFLIITHYQRLLDYIKPDFVHVLMNGKIIKSGGPELALELEKKGYENFN